MQAGAASGRCLLSDDATFGVWREVASQWCNAVHRPTRQLPCAALEPK